MADEDTRSLPGAAQAALRKRAVQAVLGGLTQAEAARVFRVHPNAVNRWIKRYRDGGWDGLGERRRGRRAGEQPALSERQQQEVMALVRDTTPDQLGLAGFLWTREAVAEVLARRDGLWLARTTVGGYLRGWGFSPRSRSGGPWGRTRPRSRAGWRGVPDHPGAGQAGGWGGGVAGGDGGPLRCGRRAARGRRWAGLR